jgi:2-polyprenyl-6-methoxyphenol hydroxylase-like FAD-dependent oxidoreductase
MAIMAFTLARYEARRRPTVRRIADLSARRGALAEVTHPVMRWVRDRLLLPVANRLADSRAYLVILQESPEQLVAMSNPGS